jgi:hypothetical protein
VEVVITGADTWTLFTDWRNWRNDRHRWPFDVGLESSGTAGKPPPFLLR